jgi:hypothetical protein
MPELNKRYAQKTLGDVFRENAAKRSAASTSAIQWELVEGGIRPLHPGAVDCTASDPGYGEPCYLAPVWVIETYDGYYPTCLPHSGKVLNMLLPYPNEAAEVSMYFHPYKGE